MKKYKSNRSSGWLTGHGSSVWLSKAMRRLRKELVRYAGSVDRHRTELFDWKSPLAVGVRIPRSLRGLP